VRVPYDEGVANRIGPEPCTLAREGTGEASVQGAGRRRASYQGLPGWPAPSGRHMLCRITRRRDPLCGPPSSSQSGAALCFAFR
jgi:hypothetical protein